MNLSHRFNPRNPDRTLNLNIKNIGKEDESHMSTQNINKTIRQKVVNDTNNAKTRAASYLARKTGDLGASEKNLRLAPNVSIKLTQPKPNQSKKLFNDEQCEIVKENEKRNKLIGVTIGEVNKEESSQWQEIVRTTIITQSNLVQIFLKYENNSVREGIPDRIEDMNIIEGNSNIGLKMVLHFRLTENEVEKLLKEKYKVDTSVGKKAELSEGRKEYFYNYLNAEGILGIQSFEFMNMDEIEKQAVMDSLNKAETYCKHPKTKEKLHQKRKEFYDIMLKDTMYDSHDVENILNRETSRQRERKEPIRLIPDSTGRTTYKLFDKYNFPRDSQFKEENKQNENIPPYTLPKNPISRALGNAYETEENLINWGRRSSVGTAKTATRPNTLSLLANETYNDRTNTSSPLGFEGIFQQDTRNINKRSRASTPISQKTYESKHQRTGSYTPSIYSKNSSEKELEDAINQIERQEEEEFGGSGGPSNQISRTSYYKEQSYTTKITKEPPLKSFFDNDNESIASEVDEWITKEIEQTKENREKYNYQTETENEQDNESSDKKSKNKELM
ncbi:hypothetical protein F8M41_022339 [Gigaspora margarita]|uniref:Uncharacterized protein n=1 Tax=Gigaspora margarita TaxID=4874 RepID=A0A8H4EI48_GIGMA|nr:hypothetical protein F8M41_022339 [Gigaspora margarita]